MFRAYQRRYADNCRESAECLITLHLADLISLFAKTVSKFIGLDEEPLVEGREAFFVTAEDFALADSMIPDTSASVHVPFSEILELVTAVPESFEMVAHSFAFFQKGLLASVAGANWMEHAFEEATSRCPESAWDLRVPDRRGGKRLEPT